MIACANSVIHFKSSAEVNKFRILIFFIFKPLLNHYSLIKSSTNSRGARLANFEKVPLSSLQLTFLSSNPSTFSFSLSWHLWFTFLFRQIYRFYNSRRTFRMIDFPTDLRTFSPRSPLYFLTCPCQRHVNDILSQQEHCESCS